MDTKLLGDMKLFPELGKTEDVQWLVSCKCIFPPGELVFCGTNKRLIVRPKKYSNLSGTKDIWYNDIKYLRRKGTFIKEIEIETEKGLEYFKVNMKDSDKIVNSLESTAKLKKHEQKGAEMPKKIFGIATASTGIVFSVIGCLIGVLLVLIGIILCITIIGAILGIPLLLFGLALLSGSGFLGFLGIKGGTWGFSRFEEWEKAN